MKSAELKHLLDLQIRRNIFEKFRRDVRYVCAPIFLLFAIVDYHYFPQFFSTWIWLRIAFACLLWGIFEALKFSHVRNHYSQHLATLGIVSATASVNFMIYQSGSTVYVTGMIIAHMAGLQLLGTSKNYSLVGSLLAYIPCSFAVWIGAEQGEKDFALLHAFFLVTGAIFAFLFSAAEETANNLWTRNQINLNHELIKLNRSEFLKKNFPPELRTKIEDGSLKLNRHKVVSGAVVGFADITASTSIANNVDLMTDWQVKESFLVAATKRATECGLIVLTHTGDGFLFLANYDDSKDRLLQVTTFFQNLSDDFQKIAKLSLTPELAFNTGIKCGVAMGPTVVGFIGESQSYFTAVGPDVNLAARLCSKATSNELVLSSRVWYEIKKDLEGWETEERTYSNLKGFGRDIPAVHCQKRPTEKNNSAA